MVLFTWPLVSQNSSCTEHWLTFLVTVLKCVPIVLPVISRKGLPQKRSTRDVLPTLRSPKSMTLYLKTDKWNGVKTYRVTIPSKVFENSSSILCLSLAEVSKNSIFLRTDNSFPSFLVTCFGLNLSLKSILFATTAMYLIRCECSRIVLIQ